jgi:hypothetical protein
MGGAGRTGDGVDDVAAFGGHIATGKRQVMSRQRMNRWVRRCRDAALSIAIPFVMWVLE